MEGDKAQTVPTAPVQGQSAASVAGHQQAPQPQTQPPVANNQDSQATGHHQIGSDKRKWVLLAIAIVVIVVAVVVLLVFLPSS